MQVEVIYRQPNGVERVLGIRKLEFMPPTGEPFSVDDKQYRANGYSGPNQEGCYKLILIDEEASEH